MNASFSKPFRHSLSSFLCLKIPDEVASMVAGNRMRDGHIPLSPFLCLPFPT